MGCVASKPAPIDGNSSPEVSVVGKIIETSPIKQVVAAAQPYKPADLPANESERLKDLRALNLLDTPPDPRFDEITQLLCKLFKVPMSIVSIIDEYRYWLKSRKGLAISEAPREIGICAWTLVPPHPELLVINDTLEDPRFKNCPIVVNPPHVRFYAGAPLVSSKGHRIGNLVVMDDKPGKMDAERCMLLANFAEIVVRQIEKSTLAMTQSYLVNKSAQSLLRALDCFSEGLMLCNVGTEGWDIVYVNDSWGKVTGLCSNTVAGTPLWSLAELHKAPTMMPQISAAIQRRAEFTALLTVNGRRCLGTFRPAHQGQLSTHMPTVGIPSDVPWSHLPSANHPFYFCTLRPATPADEQGRSLRPVSSITSQPDEPSDVVLGPVLGRGSFGKVYRAVWRGTPVAVKIMQYESGDGPRGASAKKQLEDIAGMKVVHPNIVPTYRVFSRTVAAQQHDADQPHIAHDGSWGPLSKGGDHHHHTTTHATPSDKDSAAGMHANGVPPRIGGLAGLHVSSLASDSCNGDGSGSVADSAADLNHATTAAPPPHHQHHPRRTDAASDFASVCSDLAGEDPTLEDHHSAEHPEAHHTHAARGPGAPSTAADTDDLTDAAESACSELPASRRQSHEYATPLSQSSSMRRSSMSGKEEQRVMQETWMLMELCDMGTLVDACQRGMFLRASDDNTGMVIDMHAVCETLHEVASALDYLHNMDILHADLNGNNVLLVSCNRGTRRFTAKVSDFGLSRIVNDVVQTATTGTPTHMPPELLADGDLSKGTDVYAFGVIMWEVYHGKRAWAGMHPMQVLFRVAVKKHPLDFPPDVHQDYVSLARRCLLPDRHARPTTKELVQALGAMANKYGTV